MVPWYDIQPIKQCYSRKHTLTHACFSGRILSRDDNQRYTALEKAAVEKFTTKTLLFEREKMDYMVQSTADRWEGGVLLSFSEGEDQVCRK